MTDEVPADPKGCGADATMVRVSRERWATLMRGWTLCCDIAYSWVKGDGRTVEQLGEKVWDVVARGRTPAMLSVEAFMAWVRTLDDAAMAALMARLDDELRRRGDGQEGPWS